jgi:hypothetical protein
MSKLATSLATSMSSPLAGGIDPRGLPPTLHDANEIFAAWGAVASHGWSFSAASGAEPDLASTGPVALPQVGTPTRGVVTGLSHGDLGIQTADGSTDGLAAGNNTALDVTTGDLWMVGTMRLVANPATTRMSLGKRQGNVAGYYVQLVNTGRIDFVARGAVALQANGPIGHAGTAYTDFLAILSRSSGLTMTTQLGDSGVVAVGSLGSITSAAPFRIGPDTSVTLGGPQIVTHLVWGTTTGTLSANRVAALAAWRAARGAS